MWTLYVCGTSQIRQGWLDCLFHLIWVSVKGFVLQNVPNSLEGIIYSPDLIKCVMWFQKGILRIFSQPKMLIWSRQISIMISSKARNFLVPTWGLKNPPLIFNIPVLSRLKTDISAEWTLYHWHTQRHKLTLQMSCIISKKHWKCLRNIQFVFVKYLGGNS